MEHYRIKTLLVLLLVPFSSQRQLLLCPVGSRFYNHTGYILFKNLSLFISLRVYKRYLKLGSSVIDFQTDLMCL